MRAVRLDHSGDSEGAGPPGDAVPRPLALRRPGLFRHLRAVRRGWVNAVGYSAAAVSLLAGWGWRSAKRGDLR